MYTDGILMPVFLFIEGIKLLQSAFRILCILRKNLGIEIFISAAVP